MPRVRALTSWDKHKTGDVFEASSVDAQLLCAPDAIGGQKAEYIDRAMLPGDRTDPILREAEDKRAAEVKPEKRRYLRRDLRAQD